MNKKLVAIIVAVVAVIAIGGGVWALTQNESNEDAMMKDESTSDTMKKDGAMKDDAMEEDSMKEDSAMSEDAVMAKHGSYVTLAKYNANKGDYKDTTKVYFFHAPWCPVCKAFDEELSASQSKIPTGATLIKTDFDSETELRQKYGVTYQHTFVQVDDSGNLVNKWTESDLDTALAAIKV